MRSSPSPQPEPGPPEPPTPIGAQGVAGRVEKWTGDFMPGPGPSGGEVTPLSVPVHVFSGKVKRFTSPDPTHAQLLATVRSDADGFYDKELAPGEYTVVAEIDGELYLNALAGDGTWATVTVTDGKWTEHTIVDSSDAAF